MGHTEGAGEEREPNQRGIFQRLRRPLYLCQLGLSLMSYRRRRHSDLPCRGFWNVRATFPHVAAHRLCALWPPVSLVVPGPSLSLPSRKVPGRAGWQSWRRPRLSADARIVSPWPTDLLEFSHNCKGSIRSLGAAGASRGQRELSAVKYARLRTASGLGTGLLKARNFKC